MTTSEFIEMLKKADPSGSAHVRMEGGVPFYAELKAGYWDGPYSYIDKEGRYVQTNQGVKVDIYCKDSTDLVWDNNIDWNPFDDSSIEKLWKDLKNKFVLDYGSYAAVEQRREREESFFKQLRKEFNGVLTLGWVKNFGAKIR